MALARPPAVPHTPAHPNLEVMPRQRMHAKKSLSSQRNLKRIFKHTHKPIVSTLKLTVSEKQKDANPQP